MSGGRIFSPGLVPGFLLGGAGWDGVRWRRAALACPAPDLFCLLMRVLLLVCVALSACASPRWINPANPGADLEADKVACDKDAERIGRLSQLGNQALTRNCMDGTMCQNLADTQRIQTIAEAGNAHKQCMAGRGWRELRR